MHSKKFEAEVRREEHSINENQGSMKCEMHTDGLEQNKFTISTIVLSQSIGLNKPPDALYYVSCPTSLRLAIWYSFCWLA